MGGGGGGGEVEGGMSFSERLRGPALGQRTRPPPVTTTEQMQRRKPSPPSSCIRSHSRVHSEVKVRSLQYYPMKLFPSNLHGFFGTMRLNLLCGRSVLLTSINCLDQLQTVALYCRASYSLFSMPAGLCIVCVSMCLAGSPGASGAGIA